MSDRVDRELARVVAALSEAAPHKPDLAFESQPERRPPLKRRLVAEMPTRTWGTRTRRAPLGVFVALAAAALVVAAIGIPALLTNGGSNGDVAGSPSTPVAPPGTTIPVAPPGTTLPATTDWAAGMPAYLPNPDDWIIQGGELRLYEEGGASLEMQWDHVSDDRTLEVWVSRPEPQLSMDDLSAQRRSEGEVVVGEGTMNGFPALHTRHGSAAISYWWDGDASVRVTVFGSDLPDEAVVVNLTRHEVTDESVQALLDGNGVCEPDSTVVDPLIGPEAQARTQDDVEVWALFFLTFPIRPNGDPISIPVNTEIKIVWSVTGTGDFRIEAVGPNGASIESIWEPTGHLGSSWERPGDEWDTGWTFPEVGCWTFHLQRDDSAAQLSIDVHEGDR